MKGVGTDIIGRSPISLPAMIVGKAAAFACPFFFVVKTMGVEMLYDSIVTRAAGIGFYVLGLLMVSVSLAQLGESATVGIPERKTILRTHGLYRFTRNPVYLGAFITCGGSCLYSIHLLNLILFAITVAVHFRIVGKEEKFLAERFGQEWLDYKQRVPRYLGRRTASLMK